MTQRPTTSVETERKFRIEADQQVPDLSGVVGLGATELHRMVASYYDTPDLLLARNRRTLRRRTGGHDAGWHLKLPGDGDARTEVMLPLTATATVVPGELREQVGAIIGDAPLVPVLELRTERRETALTGPDGDTVAVLCDDSVTSIRGDQQTSWRELEVELAGGNEALLDRITECFAEGGVPVSESVSKLVQALGESLAEAQRPPRPRKASAAQVVGAAFAAQVGVIQSLEAAVRRDAPDAVHRMRVATRRLRSLLRTFRPLLDRSVTDPLRVELKWLGSCLGAPRTAEVIRAQLRREVADLPAESVVGPVTDRIDRSLAEQHRVAHRDLLQAMDSERFVRLGGTLVTLLSSPIFTEYAGARARGVLPQLLTRTDTRALAAWRRTRALEGTAGEIAWHETRKRAKVARYAWEAAREVVPDAAAMADAWEQVTDSLGQVQDSVEIRQRLAEFATEATAAGESAFSYGVMHQRLLEAEESARAAAVAALKAVRSRTR